MILRRYLFSLSIIHPQFDLQLLLKNNSFAFVLSLDGRQNILCFVIHVLLCNIEKDKIFLVSICFGSQSPKIDGIHIEFDSVVENRKRAGKTTANLSFSMGVS